MTENFEDFGDWSIESRRYAYDASFWLLLGLDELLGSGLGPPIPVDLIYVLRNRITGEECTIRLSGDHKPEDLRVAIAAQTQGTENS